MVPGLYFWKHCNYGALIMKDYSKYNLEDFLLDNDFRSYLTVMDNRDNDVWSELVTQFPDKVDLMKQARDIILILLDQKSDLSTFELEREVGRILHTTESDVTANPRTSVFPIKWFSIAASVLIAVGIGWVVMHNGNQPQSAKSYRQYISSVKNPLHEVVNETNLPMLVKLPDGSSVNLTPSSRMSYADAFVQNNKREVYLSGEAFFEVEKDVKNPFFVYANGLLTRVVGTSFLIRAIDTDVEVLVRTGRVTVVPIKDIASQAIKNTELVLTPNQQVLFSTNDNLISKSIVTAPVEIVKEESEQQPDFDFDNRPIGEVFAILEKAYGIPIIYDETVMHKCYLRVTLSNEPFFSKLDIVCKTVGANYQVRDGQIIISSEGCE